MPLVEAARKSLQAVRANAHLNAFIALHPEEKILAQLSSSASPKGPIAGQLIAVKDNICTTDLPTTCASEMLRDYVSPFEATVVRRLRDAGGVVMGKTNMDEFGMGSHSTYSVFGAVRGPGGEDAEPVSAGGSSGGSAAAVAAGMCYGALGTDTGGSVRLPAAYCGVVGFKPSYGMLSRWGVVAYANSLDTVGVFGRSVASVKNIFDAANGYDPNDPTSVTPATRARIADRLSRHRKRTASSSSSSSSGPLRIGLPVEFNVAELTPPVRRAWERTLTLLAARGHRVQPVSLPTIRHALSAYYVLAPAEASSNLAKYDGLRYGHRADHDRSQGGGGSGEGGEGGEKTLFAPTRAEGFGDEVRRRVLLGAYTLSAEAMGNYFIKAQAVRRLVQRDFDAAFSARNYLLVDDEGVQGGEENAEGNGRVDVLVTPTALSAPPRLADVIAQKSPLDAFVNDVFTVPASLVGIPAISVPVRMPEGEGEGEGEAGVVGMQVMAQYADEERIWEVARELEEISRAD